MDTRERYRRFADTEARGRSAIYESWARSAADDDDIVAILDRIPETHRQPYLVFAVSRLLGAPVGEYGPWRSWVIARADDLVREASERMTQTNEPRRCASLLPALGLLPQPIALIEVGAAAGLCLYPDRYRYAYVAAPGRRGATSALGASSEIAVGASSESAVVLECELLSDAPLPTAVPEVVSRVAIDLRPLDLADARDSAWLEALVWPGEDERLRLVRAASDIVRADPPRLVRADVTTDEGLRAIHDAVSDVPAGVTPVIVTAGVLVYLPFVKRERVIRSIVHSGARWVSLEGVAVIPGVRDKLGANARATGFVVSIDAEPVAWTSPHGHHLEWFADAPTA